MRATSTPGRKAGRRSTRGTRWCPSTIHRTHVSCRWPRTRRAARALRRPRSPSPPRAAAPQALSRHGSRAPTSREGHADRNGVLKTTNHRNHRARTPPRRRLATCAPHYPVRRFVTRFSAIRTQSSVQPTTPAAHQRMPPSDADGFVATIRRGLRTAGVLVRAGEPGSEPRDAVSEQVHARRVA